MIEIPVVRQNCIARSLDLFARLNPAGTVQVAKSDLVAQMTRDRVACSERAG